MKILKVQPREIPSDDCLVTVNKATGEKVAVHVGEWIRILPVVSVGELLHIMSFRDESVIEKDLAEVKDEAIIQKNLIKVQALIAAHWRSTIQQLSRRIIEWNWTDLTGEPLPCPHGQPEVLEFLSDEELVWLVIHALNPELPLERKNA